MGWFECQVETVQMGKYRTLRFLTVRNYWCSFSFLLFVHFLCFFKTIKVIFSSKQYNSNYNQCSLTIRQQIACLIGCVLGEKLLIRYTAVHLLLCISQCRRTWEYFTRVSNIRRILLIRWKKSEIESQHSSLRFPLMPVFFAFLVTILLVLSKEIKRLLVDMFHARNVVVLGATVKTSLYSNFICFKMSW